MASSLKKAKILVFNRKTKSKTGEIPCQFNPESFAINKSASWGTPSATATDSKNNHPQPKLNAPELVFSGGQGATFSLKLFFDTTNNGNGDVRGYTNQLLKLTLITGKDTNSPPLVRFSWGAILSFYAVVKKVEVSYILFTQAGVPVRARATVDCEQAYDEDGAKGGQNPTSLTNPRKTHVVEEGDRIDYIAFKEYGQAGMWRRLAEANNLENPLILRPGQILVVPQEG